VRTHLGGELAERITWEGAGVLKLETAGVPYDGLSIVDAAAAHVREVLSSRYEHLEIHPAEAPPRIELPKGDVTLRSRDAAPMNPPRSRVPVWVDISIDGAFYRTIIVPLRVEIPGTALYARRALPRGAAALPEDFEARPVDLAAVGAEVADPTTAFGRHLARTLPAGEPLLRSSLQQSLAVNKGDIVTLLVHTGVIEIESLATALSSGVVGQKVRIKPTAGDDVIAAEVVSPNVVKLITR
jgi:flagella basal body P-ring formation protein FlgA